ncbi:DUF4136 domain-containing protein [Pontibacter sp. Tf4]|uniref:DUF4136 domain-containing protein n=1 Tax=Pontibacter sp. Tf4 TaxID=2761620 RepID=UPI0016255484|nr:DUF4136 domain-containing protein [Pontibacter sp. Tf4]MBB6613104.1 DUF4136 domain-containing protein [Pontibacter sp. Tf4]
MWKALTVLLFVWSTACTTGPVTRSTYSETANFRVYQTYAWYKAELPSPITGGGRGYSTLLDQQIKLAVESELVKNGLRPNEESPDLLIAYDIALPATDASETDTVYAPGFGYGYSYWYGYRYRYNTSGIPAYRSVASLPPGTLIVDLIDPNTNSLVWRGWYEAGLDPVVAGDKDINKAVANVMSQYPPVPVTSQ